MPLKTFATFEFIQVYSHTISYVSLYISTLCLQRISHFMQICLFSKNENENTLEYNAYIMLLWMWQCLTRKRFRPLSDVFTSVYKMRHTLETTENTNNSFCSHISIRRKQHKGVKTFCTSNPSYFRKFTFLFSSRKMVLSDLSSFYSCIHTYIYTHILQYLWRKTTLMVL